MPCFSGLFSMLHRCCVFYKPKARPSISKTITTHCIVTVVLSWGLDLNPQCLIGVPVRQGSPPELLESSAAPEAVMRPLLPKRLSCLLQGVVPPSQIISPELSSCMSPLTVLSPRGSFIISLLNPSIAQGDTCGCSLPLLTVGPWIPPGSWDLC